MMHAHTVFCIQVLLFEGSITLLVPLQEAVHSDEQRKAFPKVYQHVILGIIGFYGFFGITCWMALGQQVKIVLTTSLPQSMLATSVQLAYSLAVILTFPLQNFPALEIGCKCIGTLVFIRTDSALKRNIISSILVVCLALVAVTTMDNLDKIVSLMGGLLGCPIAFVVPPLIHSSLCHDEMTVRRKWGNRIVVFGGVLSMALATVTTLSRW
jgi:solute carrier family 36 (proton-coupled amino acid transporter)